MYNFLLIDDETFTIKGLTKLLTSLCDSINHIYTASNGLEALDILKTHKIDIIFCDIKMPQMDGLEFINKARSINTICQIVLLTGCDSFEYAQEAIENDVAHYLLKPITFSKLKTVLADVLCRYNTIEENQNYILGLQKQIEESIPIFRERFLYELMSGHYNKNLAQVLNIDFETKVFKICQISISSIKENDLYTTNHHENITLELIGVSNIIQSILCEKIEYISLILRDNIYILFYSGEPIDNILLEETLLTLQKTLSQQYAIGISCGVSSSFSDIKKFQIYVNQAVTCADHVFFTSNNSINFHENLHINNTLVQPINVRGIITDLSNYLIAEKFNDFKHNLFLLKKTFLENQQITIDFIKSTCIDIVTILIVFCYNHDISFPLMELNQKDYYEIILQSHSIDEIFDLILGFLKKIEDLLSENYKSAKLDAINSIKQFVMTHISEDITLNSLSNVVFLTPNYISSIFKKETGIGFKDYVLQEKMNHAKKLLAQNKYKVYEVAAFVGYKDVIYFSKVFKAQTGIYPSDYTG
ncbi:MAG: response regulator [Eubacteriales bacterium]